MSKRKTKQQFIEDSIKIHKDKYDYSLVDYKTAHIKVSIKCTKHGLFYITPNNHLNGRGCSDCANGAKSILFSKSVNEFIRQSKLVHGDKYDYSKVEYKNAKTKVTIICNIHGGFTKKPEKHLAGEGCIKCSMSSLSKSKTKNTEYFIGEAIKVHGDMYDYSLVDYKNAKTKIVIKCKHHGVFKQTPDNHLTGQGCPECGRDSISNKNKNNSTGWSPINWYKCAIKSKIFDSFKVYIIKCYNDNESFYKIGRTFCTIDKRFKNKKTMPYNYEVIKEFIFDSAREAFDYENKLKREHKQFKYLPKLKFNGQFECFFKINLHN